MSKVVLSYQVVVIFWTNFCQIHTLFCVTIHSIHLWTFSEIPKISTFPIHLWKFSGNPNISTLPRITTFVEIFGKTKISTTPLHLWKFSGNPNISTPSRTRANREPIRNYFGFRSMYDTLCCQTCRIILSGSL